MAFTWDENHRFADSVREGLEELGVLPAEGTRMAVHEPLRWTSQQKRDVVTSHKAKADHVVVAAELRLEGTLGKRFDSAYEPSERSGAWIKYRTNMAQEFAIGGYILGGTGSRHSLIFRSENRQTSSRA